MDPRTVTPRVEISLDALLGNLSAIRSRTGQGVGVLAVVKDCAYGCGAKVIARTLEKDGAVAMFAVSRPSEAFFLRRNSIASPILVLGPASGAELKKGFEAGIVFSLNDADDLLRWKSIGVPVRFHCNIDTRMHRMGILPSEAEMVAHGVMNCPQLCCEGVFTHLANADAPQTSTVAQQLNTFQETLSVLRRCGVAPRHIHYANSAGLMRFDLPGCTLVRPGIALYGCKPDPAQIFPLDLTPIASLRGSIVKMKKVGAGTPISYGGRYTTGRETNIATIALGYAHGVPRSLGNRGQLLIGGQRFGIAGTVTMDYIMADVGPDASCRVGDEAVVIGSQRGDCISPDDVALLDNTIGYEILCRLATSIDRIYLRGGNVVAREKGRFF